MTGLSASLPLLGVSIQEIVRDRIGEILDVEQKSLQALAETQGIDPQPYQWETHVGFVRVIQDADLSQPLVNVRFTGQSSEVDTRGELHQVLANYSVMLYVSTDYASADLITDAITSNIYRILKSPRYANLAWDAKNEVAVGLVSVDSVQKTDHRFHETAFNVLSVQLDVAVKLVVQTPEVEGVDLLEISPTISMHKPER